MTHVHSLPAEWLPVSNAPSDADLEVCVMDYDGIIHALVFPCLCSVCAAKVVLGRRCGAAHQSAGDLEAHRRIRARIGP
jgi:hypothetical protein